MKIKTLGVLSFVLLLALAFPSIVSAKPTSLEACTEDTVSGIVVAVLTTGEMTVYQEDGTLCTVVKNTEAYNHPVINILGEYFEKVSLEDFESLQTRVEKDVDTWIFPVDPDSGAVNGTVIGVADIDGTYYITVLVEDVTEPQTIKTDNNLLYNTYLKCLETNTTTFNLIIDEFGNAFVSDGADEIGAYHDDGMGLGVLVKLYAMADAYDVPVDDLVTRFKNGEGIGQLFKDEDLGKPDLLGVGHVFNELGKNPGHPDGKNNPSASNKSDKPGKGNNK